MKCVDFFVRVTQLDQVRNEVELPIWKKYPHQEDLQPCYTSPQLYKLHNRKQGCDHFCKVITNCCGVVSDHWCNCQLLNEIGNDSVAVGDNSTAIAETI